MHANRIRKPWIFIFITIASCQPDTPSTSWNTSESVIGFGSFLSSCAAGKPPQYLRPSDYWDYGCYSGKGGEGTPVDETDKCAQIHDACWAKVEKDTGVGCFFEGYDSNHNDPATGKPTADCSKWTFAESCSKAKHPSNDKREEEDCCACDLEAVKCFQKARATYNPKYKDWSDNGDPGPSCGPNKGKSFTCASGYIRRGEPCVNGTKVGNRLIGYWCETTCNKPEACETSNVARNAYARCAAPPALAQTCDVASPVVARIALSLEPEAGEAVEPPCVGAECDECPHCSADTCGGNHAPADPAEGDDELPPGWEDDAPSQPDAPSTLDALSPPEVVAPLPN